MEPERLWYFFDQLTRIPRPSKSEGKVIQYIEEFGKNQRLVTIRDKTGNIIIKKQGSKGLSNRKTIILQAHVDMVPQKNKGTVHDFEKDPIHTYIEGDWMKAKGTTLGADNGIGVAAILSILESDDIEHGPIEALFTVDEETGMTGAFGIEEKALQGNIMLNLDSEDDTYIIIGCAGGEDLTATFTYKEKAVPDKGKSYKISVSGFKGGHSGLDINLGRGNAIKVLTRFLYSATQKYGIHLASMEGGSLRNAIPREAIAFLLVPDSKDEEFLDFVKNYTALINEEYGLVEPDLKIAATPTILPCSLLPEEKQFKILQVLHGLPNGVIRMNPSFEDVVETSTNLAAIDFKPGKMEILCLLRSSVDSAKVNLATRMEALFNMAGAKVKMSGAYPGWDPKPEAEILGIMKKVYHKKFKAYPDIQVIHAGLECGIIGSKYPDMEMASIGAIIKNPHSPDEMVSIPSVGKFFEYLLEVLRNAPTK